MAFVRPLIDYNGNLQEVAVNDYIQPAILGAGTPSSNTILDGSGNWVTIASLNYWTLSGSDVYRATGNVYIGSASSYGAYKLQVTGSSYFVGNTTFNSHDFYLRDDSGFLQFYVGEGTMTINPTIYNTPLDGTTTLLKAVDGVITRAVAKDITDMLGTDKYIQNQNASAQTGNFWISGRGTFGDSVVTGGSNSEYPIALYVNPSTHATSRRAVIALGNFGQIISDVAANGNNDFGLYNSAGSWSLFLKKSNNFIGIGTTEPLDKLHVIGGFRAYNTGSNTITAHLYLANVANSRAYNWQLNADGSSLDFYTFDGSWNKRITYGVNGNVGIGVAPDTKLQIDVANVANTKLLKFSTSSGVNNYGDFSVQSAELRLNGQNALGFAPNNTLAMLLDNSGRVLVNYTSAVGTWKVQINSGSATDNGLYVNGHIRATGNIIGDGYFSGTSSDLRYKSNFESVKVLDVIDKINIYSYNHKLYNNARLIGSVAQELEKYFPELITKDEKGFLRVDNYGYAALSLQLGKELKSEVDILKDRVKELEIKLQLLENK